MTNFINNIHAFIAQNNLIPENSTIIVGLSGGPDSVFLLNLLHGLHKQKNIKIIAAHLDHGWRKNSAEDIIFCQNICDQLGITFVHTNASALPDSLKEKGSLEEIGRRMRRYYLQQVLTKYNADLIALGHHLQDQEETFFIRLIRGSTLSGLTCMKPRDGVYIRPLLETNKKDIVTYLDQHTITYLTDPSNESESFLRNRIRLNVLPALQKCDERFNANFLRTLHNLQETEIYLQNLTVKAFEALADQQNNVWHLDLKKLRMLDPFMQKRLVLHWLIAEQVPFVPTEKFLQEIIRFLHQPEGKKHQMHETWSISKKQHSAHIEKA